MSRQTDANHARTILGDDFFGGWNPEDAALFEKYAAPGGGEDGFITDYFGLRTRSAFHPGFEHVDGVAIADPPIPDDMVRAEAIEYFATLHALDTAAPDKFVVAELGASYGPWICFCAVLARRTGRSDIRLTAVEASQFQFELIPVHLRNNNVDPDADNVRLMCGAVSTTRETLYFPKVRNPSENGGQAVTEKISVDYVGREVEHEPVKGLPLSDIFQDEIYDLVHLDIQGSEAAVLAKSMQIVNAQVRSIFIGTHSRLIEGQLLELFHREGWRLLRERPTKFSYCQDRPDVIGWTTRDGGQYWVNPRL